MNLRKYAPIIYLIFTGEINDISRNETGLYDTILRVYNRGRMIYCLEKKRQGIRKCGFDLHYYPGYSGFRLDDSTHIIFVYKIVHPKDHAHGSPLAAFCSGLVLVNIICVL